MNFITLENINKQASQLVYGTPGVASAEISDKAIEAYDMAYSMGFRIFDTAHSYGRGEENLGRWISKRSNRKDIIILDKGCNPNCTYTTPDIFSADTIRNQVSESLNRLQTDYIDLYVLHRDDPSKPVDEIVEVLNELHGEGKILRFGGSNWTMDRIMAANEYAATHGLIGFSVCSPNYTYMNLIRDPWGGSVTLTGAQNEPFRKWLIDNQMPVFSYSALARGFLSGKYRTDSTLPIYEVLSEAPIMEYYDRENVERLMKAEKLADKLSLTVPQIGIAWLLKQKLNIFPIVCPTGEKHLKDVVDAVNIKLSDEDFQYLQG